MPIRNHTGRTYYRLKGSAGQTQSPPGEMSWLLNSVAKITDGKLCNYLLGLLVTVTGTWTPTLAATAWGTYPDGLRTMHRIARDLIDSIELRAAWHGTVLSAQHVKGSFLELLEFVANGLERPFRERKPVGAKEAGPDTLLARGTKKHGAKAEEPGTAAPEDFRFSFWVPCSLLCGRKGHHTALPVALYDDAEFVINPNPLTVPNGRDNSFGEYTNVTFDVSADVLPDAEVRLGPGLEWIDYQQKTSGEAVDIQNLGRVSTLDGTEVGAGIAGLFYLSNREGLPGPTEVKNLIRLTFPFRGIVSTQHVDGFLLQTESMTSGLENPMVGDPTSLGGTLGPFGSDDQIGFPNAPGDIGAGADKANPVVLGLILPARDFETSKCQTSEGTQQLQMQFSPAVTNGTHHILALQLRSWTPAAFLSAKQKLIDTGVCRAVIGTDDVTWSLKVQNKQNPALITDKKKRFFAMRLIATPAAAPKVA